MFVVWVLYITRIAFFLLETYTSNLHEWYHDNEAVIYGNIVNEIIGGYCETCLLAAF